MGGCCVSKPKKKHHLSENFIVERKKSVEADYKIIEKIGKGSIGVIYLAESRRPKFYDDISVGARSVDNSRHGSVHGSVHGAHENSTSNAPSPSRNNEGKRRYAIKEIDTKMIDTRALDSLKTEIQLLKNLDHPFIIKFFGSYSSKVGDREKLSVVMEYCRGGTLDKFVPYDENVAMVLVANIVEAVLYLHKHNIIHRDLKVRPIFRNGVDFTIFSVFINDLFFL